MHHISEFLWLDMCCVSFWTYSVLVSSYTVRANNVLLFSSLFPSVAFFVFFPLVVFTSNKRQSKIQMVWIKTTVYRPGNSALQVKKFPVNSLLAHCLGENNYFQWENGTNKLLTRCKQWPESIPFSLKFWFRSLLASNEVFLMLLSSASCQVKFVPKLDLWSTKKEEKDLSPQKEIGFIRIVKNWNWSSLVPFSLSSRPRLTCPISCSKALVLGNDEKKGQKYHLSLKSDFFSIGLVGC